MKKIIKPGFASEGRYIDIGYEKKFQWNGNSCVSETYVVADSIK